MLSLLNVFLLTWTVSPYWCRPSNERTDQNENTWSNFLTRFDALFENQQYANEAPPTPQYYNDFCGTKPAAAQYPTSKIVGGTDAKLGEFPWQAGLSLVRSGGGVARLMCGGTILTDKAVLTAAHCLHHPPSRYHVLVGILYSSLDTQQDHQQSLIVEKFIKHPEYNSRTYKNDIGLVLVRSPYGQGIWWSDYVLPVCLPKHSYDHFYKENTEGTVSGWGLVEEGDSDQATVLQHVDIEVQDLTECQDSYSTTLVTENQFCAGQRSGGRDSCSGDSGGPFTTHDISSGKHFVTGVVSFGVGCGRSQYPGVYTRVDKYLPWIKNQMEVTVVSGHIGKEVDLMSIMERQVGHQHFTVPFSHSNALQTVCSGNSQVLSCPPSSLIKITQAFYGRDSSPDCPGPALLPTDICSLPTVLADLQSYCQGRRLCTVVPANKEDGGPFNTNPCPHYQPFVRLAYVCHHQEGAGAVVVEGSNFIQRRSANMETGGIENISPEMEVQNEEFPDKKSAAWHSKPWERRQQVKTSLLSRRAFETENHSRLNDQRLRFLVHEKDNVVKQVSVRN